MNWGDFKQLSVVGSPSVSDGVLSLELSSGAGCLLVSLFAGGLRFRVGVVDVGIVVGEATALNGRLDTVDNGCVYTCGSQVVEIGFSPFCFRYIVDGIVVQESGVDGHFVRKFKVPPLSRYGDKWWFSLNLQEEEGVYGHGEKFGALNHRGRLIKSWNHDSLGVNDDKAYKNAPFCFGTNGWGLFVHTNCWLRHGVGCGKWSNRCYVVELDSDCLDLFIFAGDGKKVLHSYCSLTGFSEEPPVYSLGINQSRAYYHTPDKALEVATELRERNFPADIITLDGRAWLDTDSRFFFEWDKTRYPEPKKSIDKLRAMNFEVCVWLYPMVSVTNSRFTELEKKGYFLKDSKTGGTYKYEWDKEPFAEILTPLPTSAFFDFTNSDAYDLWLDMHKEIFSQGVSMLMPDFGEQVAEGCVASNGMNGKELHNIYGFLFNRCCWEASKKYVGDKAFLFSRCCWSGSQRFPSQWGGDPQCDFSGLAASIRGSLSWGLSGGAFTGTDIGGFYKDERSGELFVRWAQMSTFAAHFRFHGIGKREPWSYGEEVYGIVLEIAKLRYRLIPYLHRMVQNSCETGLPVQRAMVLGTSDKLAWGFNTQFFCGEDLLVIPVIKSGGKVSFYLPRLSDGLRWVTFLTNEAWEGGRLYEMEIALDNMLVFAKEGATIPLASSDLQYTKNKLPEIVEEWKAIVS